MSGQTETSAPSCMSRHYRLSQIGRNRPKTVAHDRHRSPAPVNDFHDDPIGF
jgi:hypothetical protein